MCDVYGSLQSPHHGAPFRSYCNTSTPLWLTDHCTTAKCSSIIPSCKAQLANLTHLQIGFALQQQQSDLTSSVPGKAAYQNFIDLCWKQAPCQHNFCLGCFNKWTGQGKKTCPTCRAALPAKFSSNPRINTALATAIRMAKLGQQRPSTKQQVEVSGQLPSHSACVRNILSRSGLSKGNRIQAFLPD